MVADAKAKLGAGGKPAAEEAELPTEDVRPLEDRYVDDGSVTTEDRKKFSLRTGGTATALPAAAAAIPGEKMDERELVQEIGRGPRTAILIVAAVVIVAMIVVVAMMHEGQGKQQVPCEPSPPAGGRDPQHAASGRGSPRAGSGACAVRGRTCRAAGAGVRPPPKRNGRACPPRRRRRRQARCWRRGPGAEARGRGQQEASQSQGASPGQGRQEEALALLVGDLQG